MDLEAVIRQHTPASTRSAAKAILLLYMEERPAKMPPAELEKRINPVH